MSLTNVIKAAHKGGEPQGNIGDLPAILQGLMHQPIHRMTPEMLRLLSPMAIAPAGLINKGVRNVPE